MTTLYRATSGVRPALGARTAWTPDLHAAVAYTRNPGFGGDTVWRARFTPRHVLDLTAGRSASYAPSLYAAQWGRLYAALADDRDGARLLEAEGWTRATFADGLGAYVHHAWENHRGVFAALASMYSWVVFFDDFPEGTPTWVKLDAAPIVPAPTVYLAPPPTRRQRVRTRAWAARVRRVAASLPW